MTAYYKGNSWHVLYQHILCPIRVGSLQDQHLYTSCWNIVCAIYFLVYFAAISTQYFWRLLNLANLGRFKLHQCSLEIHLFLTIHTTFLSFWRLYCLIFRFIFERKHLFMNASTFTWVNFRKLLFQWVNIQPNLVQSICTVLRTSQIVTGM